MAKYIGPNGEVDAHLLDEDKTFQPSGTVGKKGEWVVRDVDGLQRLCASAVFVTQFRQKYPRAVDAKPEPITPNSPMVV